MTTSRTRNLLLGAVTVLATTAAVAPASGAMRSQRLADGTCLTTGGGRFVSIPGFPGERIDQRLLPDLHFLEQRYKVYVTDGLSDDPVHAAGGEHPLGLALDLVPNSAVGGTWRDITRLAKFAEPVQNQTVPPFRWVGYNGDAGHGRGNHLHLSWSHSDSKPGHPAKSVYTMRCPRTANRGGAGTTTSPPTTSTGGGKGGGRKHGGPAGGVEPGAGTGGTSGGIGVGRAKRSINRMGPPIVERGGVSRRDA